MNTRQVLHTSFCVLLAFSLGCSDDDNGSNSASSNNKADVDMSQVQTNTSSQTTQTTQTTQTNTQPTNTERDMGQVKVDMNTSAIEDMNAGMDMKVEMDMATEPDIGSVGDDVGVKPDTGDSCDEAAQIIAAWPLQSSVAQTTVTATQEAGVWTATIDAAAGGSMQSRNNPFIYLDLDGGAKVETSDVDAVNTNTTWEIGFRRTAAFINSGDAGPGTVEITKLEGKTFDMVTVADIPTSGSFITEDPVTPDCKIVPPMSGFGSVESVFERLNFGTTSGSWFNYGMAGGRPSILAYPDHVYIIQKTDMNKRYKFAFVEWTSGVYKVQWQEL